LKNAGEDILAMFFTVEYDFDSMSIDLSGRNFAKIIAKDSGDSPRCLFSLAGPIIIGKWYYSSPINKIYFVEYLY
jgi:hypothetical protein